MSLPNKGKILALDLGTKRTGVAVSDKDQQIAFLRDELEHDGDADLLAQLEKLLAGEPIVGILAGVPLYLSGENSPQTEKVLKQIDLLEKFALPIQKIDERFSTVEAFAPKMKVVDSRSAQIILENYFRTIRNDA
ncbi:MAG: Holliday junction resolvase RuvX [Patescibacteria group bacterium]